MKKPLQRIVLLLALAGSVLAAVASPAASSGGASTKVSPSVLRATSGGAKTTFMVVLSSRADLSGAAAQSGKVAKGTFVFKALRAHATRTQAPVVALLDRMGATHRSHWLINALRVTGDRQVVDALAARADVARIFPNSRMKSIILPAKPATVSTKGPSAIEWNISRVRAPRAWQRGFTGQGIVLGNIDTGQQWNHPALKSHYRGWDGSTADHNYNWFDATTPPSNVPIDPYGHGTHTAGIMIGDDGGSNQIGVAPGAKWMACRSMDSSGFGEPDTYITCFEFMMAPWDLSGQNPDPSKAPVAVSNSWYCSISLEGCSQADLFQVVQNVRAAGIVPVVAAGNSGSLCRTIGNDGPPAQYDESYTVGASTFTNALASFSSRGPVRVQGQRLIKPDIVAPGDGVRSSYSIPPNSYATLSGTSMATPHIAGAIAVLYSAKPSLIGDVQGTEDAINNTAFHVNSSECDSSGSFPNNLWGYGLLNVDAATR